MQDEVRYALRVLGKSPLLTAALVVSLGIGTGANAAVFNLISALLLRPPAGLADPGGLVVVNAAQTAGGGLASRANLDDVRAMKALDALSAYDDSVTTGVVRDGTSRPVRVASVTPDLFAT